MSYHHASVLLVSFFLSYEGNIVIFYGGVEPHGCGEPGGGGEPGSASR